MIDSMKDITNQRFGSLVAISRSESGINGATAWYCACDCGNTKLVRLCSLRTGNTKSCGCGKAAANRSRESNHGLRKSGAYKSWSMMLQRCTNPKDPNYRRYGGAGITVCARWLDFRCFYEDMGERPAGLTLDRINNLVGYEPSNCRWASRLTQSRNRDIAKTTKEIADRIRALYLMGFPLKGISLELNVRLKTVNNILYIGYAWQEDDH